VLVNLLPSRYQFTPCVGYRCRLPHTERIRCSRLLPLPRIHLNDVTYLNVADVGLPSPLEPYRWLFRVHVGHTGFCHATFDGGVLCTSLYDAGRSPLLHACRNALPRWFTARTRSVFTGWLLPGRLPPTRYRTTRCFPCHLPDFLDMTVGAVRGAFTTARATLTVYTVDFTLPPRLPLAFSFQTIPDVTYTWLSFLPQHLARRCTVPLHAGLPANTFGRFTHGAGPLLHTPPAPNHHHRCTPPFRTRAPQVTPSHTPASVYTRRCLRLFYLACPAFTHCCLAFGGTFSWRFAAYAWIHVCRFPRFAGLIATAFSLPLPLVWLPMPCIRALCRDIGCRCALYTPHTPHAHALWRFIWNIYPYPPRPHCLLPVVVVVPPHHTVVGVCSGRTRVCCCLHLPTYLRALPAALYVTGYPL